MKAFKLHRHHRSHVYKRNFNNFGSNKLKEDLNKIDWNIKIYKDGENVNAFSIFYKTLRKTVEKELTLQLKPWSNKKTNISCGNEINFSVNIVVVKTKYKKW